MLEAPRSTSATTCSSRQLVHVLHQVLSRHSRTSPWPYHCQRARKDKSHHFHRLFRGHSPHDALADETLQLRARTNALLLRPITSPRKLQCCLRDNEV